MAEKQVSGDNLLGRREHIGVKIWDARDVYIDDRGKPYRLVVEETEMPFEGGVRKIGVLRRQYIE